MAKFKDVESPHVVIFTWPGHADDKVINWVKNYKPQEAHTGIDPGNIHPFYLPGQRIAVVLIYDAAEENVRKFCKKFIKSGDIKVQVAKAIEWEAIQNYVQD